MKKVVGKVKLQIIAGQATPAPPVGPALGQHGINIMEFCKAFNAATKDKGGMLIPVVITIYHDKSFSFITKTPPVSVLLKKAAQLAKGASAAKLEKVGKITRKQLEEIARVKLPDLNTSDIAKAIKMVEGTAKSMGIEVVD